MADTGRTPPLDAGFQQRWRQRFEQFARGGRDEAGVAGWTRTGLATRVRNFQRHWQAQPAQALWLDAGCGAGTYVRLLAQSGVQTIGVDYSRPSLDKARQWVPDCRAWCAADVSRLPFPDATADGVLCFGVLQAIADPAAALGELVRITRPGGVVWVDALNGEFILNRWIRWRRYRRGQGVHLRYDTLVALQEHFSRQGLVDIQVQWIPILPERLQWFQSWFESSWMQSLFNVWPWFARQFCHAFALRGRRFMRRAQ